MSVEPTSSYQNLKYYGNRSTTEVHHVPSETANCQLAEIKDGVRFIPDTRTEAHNNGYDNCHYCSIQEKYQDSYTTVIDDALTFFCREELLGERDYVAGRIRAPFSVSAHQVDRKMFDDKPNGGGSYEDRMCNRVRKADFDGPFLLVGGLGAGKTTFAAHLGRQLKSLQMELIRENLCDCKGCPRQPLLLDYLPSKQASPLDKIKFKILREICTSFGHMAIDHWWQERGRAPRSKESLDDRQLNTLTALFICNDVFQWASRSENHALTPVICKSQYELAEDIVEHNAADVAAMRTLCASKASAAADVQDAVNQLQLEELEDLTAGVASRYLHGCGGNTASAINLLMIDNIDQLPTNFIGPIVNMLDSLSRKVDGFKILVPVRPSSVGHGWAVGTTPLIAHYGPDCAEMMITRLRNNILGLSRAELVQQSVFDKRRPAFGLRKSPDDRIPDWETRKPAIDDDELDGFIAATVFYLRLMECALPPPLRDLRWEEKQTPQTQYPSGPKQIHDDHSRFVSLRLGGAIAKSVTRTLRAMIGTSARYALEHLHVYYEALYERPDLLAALVNRVKHPAHGDSPIPYQDVVDLLLPEHDPDVGRLRWVNLFRVENAGPNSAWPSLVKVRILQILRDGKRHQLGRLFTEMGLYGIPEALVVENINHLQDKRGLLLWLSTNRPIAADTESREEDVSISEHGKRYIDPLLGDFEYLLACATEIGQTSSEHPTRVERLGHFLQFSKNLTAADWLQNAFRLRSPSVGSSHSAKPDLQSLRTLYASVPSVIQTVEDSAKPRSETGFSANDRESVQRWFVDWCDMLEDAEDSFAWLFGSRGSLDGFVAGREKARGALQSVAGDDSEYSRRAATLLDGWHEATDDRSETAVTLSPPSTWRFWLVSSLNTAMALVPNKFAEVLKMRMRARSSEKTFTGAVVDLRNLVGETIPTYWEVEQELAKTMNAGTVLINTHNDLLAGTLIVGPYAKVNAELVKAQAELERLHYASGAADINAMTERKIRFNKLLRLYRGLAIRLGANDWRHLDAQWVT